MFDLGPSWCWPQAQPAIAALVDELGLETFVQSSTGDVVFERMSREPAHRYIPRVPPLTSIRFTGGTVALVHALAASLPPQCVRTSTTVQSMSLTTTGVTLQVEPQGGEPFAVVVDQVVAAVPPRVLQASVSFEPEVGATTERLWRSTATWMAPHAKFFAVYARPFWFDAGLSGTAQSMVGPMVEIHDASTPNGPAALFGFLGVAAAERQHLGESALARACIEQFARIFGPDARTPQATLFKDWAIDALTATEDDWSTTGHPIASGSWVAEPWESRLVMAGSETSPHEAGYLAGAVEASALAAAEVLRRLESRKVAE